MFSRHSEPLPPGAVQANWFSLFNAISWQITLGSPLILYAKSMGATATGLGVLAALTPLLVILQIPAAHLLPRYGYRKFILAGWGSRTVCIFGLAIVPLLTFLEPAARLSLVLLLLFVFNLLRGMASGAWMPWMSSIIPYDARARFLSRDQFFAQIGCLISLVMAAVTLSQEPKPWQFSLVFLFSALGATVSIVCLTRIPDVTAPEQLLVSGTRVPWLHMLRYPPFLRLTTFNLLYVVAVGGLGVFSISFLRAEAGYSERLIVSLSTLSVTGAILTLPYTARILNRTGSRPILAMCLAMFAVVLAGWFTIATGLLGRPPLVVAVLMLIAGVTGVNYQVSNARLAMATMPVMGRNHFFAIYTVITSMAAGLSPIAWGLLLDGIGAWRRPLGPLDLNRFSVFFAAACVACIIAALYGLRLIEARRELESELGVEVSPQADASSPVTAGSTPATARIRATRSVEPDRTPTDHVV